MEEKVDSEIDKIIHVLESQQSGDGSWRFCVESGPMTDAYLIILFQALMRDEGDLMHRLAGRIAQLQTESGVWRLFWDEPSEGNLSATIESYYALLAADYFEALDERMQLARRFILDKGGLSKAGMATKVMLASTGQIPWRKYSLPIEFIFSPSWFPINFYDFVGYARVHIAPVLLASHCKSTIWSPRLPDLSDLYGDPLDNSSFSPGHRELASFAFTQATKKRLLQPVAEKLRAEAVKKTEQFLLQRIEQDGTLYSYASSTFLMIYALFGLGYGPNHPTIERAINGLKTLVFHKGTISHLQNFSSTVWDTALLSYAVQETIQSESHPMIRKSIEYLLLHQQRHTGDWMIHNPDARPGGWGFSHVNRFNPDIDDTTAALRAIARARTSNSTIRTAWNRGLEWLLSMQNNDGGWAAFEKNTDKRLLSNIEVDGAKSVLTDPSSVDLTGRTLEFLGNYAGFKENHPVVQRSLKWLFSQQKLDGSWYGRWGICYIYGTWAALTGMRAVGVPASHPALQRAVDWLLSIQNPDGGWGESCRSDIEQTFVPLTKSTPSQTAWAVDALVSVFTDPLPAINRGIQFLCDYGFANSDWTTAYPTGAGLPGGFYMHYHSYRYSWPLLALGNYRNKYISRHNTRKRS